MSISNSSPALRIAAAALLLASIPPVIGSDLDGPSLGFVPDGGGRSVRQIRGIPGAAAWGDSVRLAEDTSVIAIAQRRDFAVLMTRQGVRTASLSSTPTLSDPGLPTAFRPSVIAFSPSGESAVLYGAGELWFLRNGSAHPVAPPPGIVSNLAVSDGEEPLIAGLTEADRQAVFVLDSHGKYRLIEGFQNATDLTFVGATSDLAVADTGARQLLLVRNPLAHGIPEFLFGRPGAQAGPGILFLSPSQVELGEGALRIASSANGNLLAVLAGASQAGVLYLANRQWTSFACDSEAPVLAPLRGNAVFQISQTVGRPLWVLDGDAAEPRVVFVPAEARQ